MGNVQKRKRSEDFADTQFVARKSFDVSNGFNTYVSAFISLSPLFPISPSFFKPTLTHSCLLQASTIITFPAPLSSIPLGFWLTVEKAMDEEGMSSDETDSSSRFTIKSSDGRRDSRGHFVIQLAGTSRRDVTEKDAQYCYSLLEAMPMPGPVWSTTEPCVLAEPPLSTAVAEAPTASSEGSVELEWGENQASSYAWWIGFLETLDGNMSSEKVKCPFVENVVNEDSKGFGYDSTFVDATDQSRCLDDWLMVPTMEMDLEDVVVP
ncbi:uncharacterized protein LOC129289661 isoform X1 [Prosopis cineraria]|uniref:uncharacterized protein LOC129289661 isoform X1 n=1 Tax=Prosopis cineraria TaxID=364024 RepID=UPI00240ECB79|nr:uncharacterized protein LOC129289661 isoform X1 [Prosopis cineraria]